jgi:hypothetical protein
VFSKLNTPFIRNRALELIERRKYLKEILFGK